MAECKVPRGRRSQGIMKVRSQGVDLMHRIKRPSFRLLKRLSTKGFPKYIPTQGSRYEFERAIAQGGNRQSFKRLSFSRVVPGREVITGYGRVKTGWHHMSWQWKGADGWSITGIE